VRETFSSLFGGKSDSLLQSDRGEGSGRRTPRKLGKRKTSPDSSRGVIGYPLFVGGART